MSRIGHHHHHNRHNQAHNNKKKSEQNASEKHGLDCLAKHSVNKPQPQEASVLTPEQQAVANHAAGASALATQNQSLIVQQLNAPPPTAETISAALNSLIIPGDSLVSGSAGASIFMDAMGQEFVA